MKLKTEWKQNYTHVKGTRVMNHEYMDTPFGRLTITLDGDTDRYEEPYQLHIPGNDYRYFESPKLAKQFTDTFLLSAVSKLVDTTSQTPT